MKRWFGLAALVAILLGLVIGYLLKQESLSRQLNRELELLRQSGEPVTLADLLPPVPPNEDGTSFYQLAIAQLETAKKRLSKTVWDSVYEFISRQPSKPVRLSDVQLALQAAQPTGTRKTHGAHCFLTFFRSGSLLVSCLLRGYGASDKEILTEQWKVT